MMTMTDTSCSLKLPNPYSVASSDIIHEFAVLLRRSFRLSSGCRCEMGKKRGPKQQRSSSPPQQAAAGPDASTSSSGAMALEGKARVKESGKSCQPTTQSKDTTRLPLPFPSHLPRPASGFLRNQAPYQESFAAALQTSYLGFEVDENVTDNEVELQRTLTEQPLANHFRTDVTQPFGLGTPCAKTYVTRCLVGEDGTTYKYLGLRMFAHPWSKVAAIESLSRSLTQRVATVHLPQLEQQRRKVYRHDSSQQQQQHYPLVRGRAAFDVCLINRMTASHPHLKQESLDPSLRTTVSWHADSSLEHYSTIAVYQTLISAATSNSTISSPSSTSATDHSWSVALRVAPHSEGPGSTNLKKSSCEKTTAATTDTSSSLDTEAPPIAISLPSNSAYYLLDDFNHHHQHTVLTTTKKSTKKDSRKSKPKSSSNKGTTDNRTHSDWIRYSLTFRLLRESHNVAHILSRCERMVQQSFHKPKSTKLIRSQQLLQTELETEWLRQFYIQGSQHYELQWPTWRASIQQLWHYWSRLEERTHHVVVWLKHAAEGQCLYSKNDNSSDTVAVTRPAVGTGSSVAALTKSERKLRDKRRKAVASLQELLGREGPSTSSVPISNGTKAKKRRSIAKNDQDGDFDHDDSNDVEGGTVFAEMAHLLEARATMRELWTQRERDAAFRDLSVDCQPIPFPAQFQGGHVGGNNSADHETNEENGAGGRDSGTSPMPGTPRELRQLANHVRAYERAFQFGLEQDLPDDELLVSFNETSIGPSVAASVATSSSTKVMDDEHTKSMDWSEWGAPGNRFGLEMQSPWAEAVMDGKKTIETRNYDLPKNLLNQEIAILQSPLGKAGVSSLGNRIDLQGSDGVKVIGYCIFSKVKTYTNRAQFVADKKDHCVAVSSGYGWKDSTKVVFGWVVSKAVRSDDLLYRSGTRRLRSLFELHPLENPSTTLPQAPQRQKKKQPKEKRRTVGPDGTIKKKRRF